MRREQSAWIDDLARRHGRMIFTTAYRLLGNEHDAEDVLQETMLELLNGKVKGKAVRDWGAFLRVMASRRAIDQLRRSLKHHKNVAFSENLAASADGPSRNARQRGQKAALLRNAMSRLGQQEAEVFSLRYIEEFSYEQIAKELDLGVSQVGVILHRTRRRLQEILDPTLGSSLSKEASNA